MMTASAMTDSNAGFGGEPQPLHLIGRKGLGIMPGSRASLPQSGYRRVADHSSRMRPQDRTSEPAEDEGASAAERSRADSLAGLGGPPRTQPPREEPE
jgi:hypothetical protein